MFEAKIFKKIWKLVMMICDERESKNLGGLTNCGSNVCDWIKKLANPTSSNLQCEYISHGEEPYIALFSSCCGFWLICIGLQGHLVLSIWVLSDPEDLIMPLMSPTIVVSSYFPSPNALPIFYHPKIIVCADYI